MRERDSTKKFYSYVKTGVPFSGYQRENIYMGEVSSEV